ncbi:MAG: prepilin-type N-terminal cleavage/methylation domain-containing protein [Pseudomonadota bacterium]
MSLRIVISPTPLAYVRGFTLVELLIAISLLGLISVVTYSAIWTASRSLKTVQQRTEVNDELRVTQEFLRQSLSQARGVMAANEGLMKVVFFGKKNTLSFVAPAPLQRGNAGGLYYYRFDLSGGDGKARSLRLSYRQYLVGMEFDLGLQPQGESLLMENVAVLSFSYYGSDEPGADGEWMAEWPRIDSLPQLVRITLKNANSDEASTLTVAIKGQVG